MSQAVKLDVFYPYPPKRVWQVLTDRRALAAWMMDNDFEPKLGHRFRFHSHPLPGLTTTIHCEVVELEEPTRLVYTWQESPTAEPSLVIWTLTPVAGGTQLHLKHQEYSYTTAVSALNNPGAISAKRNSIGEAAPKGLGTAGTDRHFGLFQSEVLPVTSGLEAASPSSNLRFSNQSNVGTTIALKSPASQIFAWEYFLNQKLPNLLAQNERIEN